MKEYTNREKRKIDALVAEKVMGWEYINLVYYGADEETERQKELYKWFDKVGIESVGKYFIDVDLKYWIEKKYWKPTKKLEHAFKVIEKLRSIFADEHCAKAGEPTVWRIYDLFDAGWAVEIIWLHHDGEIAEQIVESKNLCLAICLCALMYVGVDVGKELEAENSI